MKNIQDELAKTDILYISILDEETQNLTLHNVPKTFRGVVIFLDQPPLSHNVVQLCPEALYIVRCSPGIEPHLTETHPFITATRQEVSSYSISSIVIVYFLLTFVRQWDDLIEQRIVTRQNSNFQSFLIFSF